MLFIMEPDQITSLKVLLLSYKEHLLKKNTFVAETVKTRCPSKYEGEDIENYDPEAHKKLLDQPPAETDQAK
jgi:hypothetical protein